MREQQLLAKRLAPVLIRAGVNPDLSAPSKGVDYDGDGFKDSFSKTTSSAGLIPEDIQREAWCKKRGYTPGSVKQMKVKGLGDVVYNTAEKVKYFDGMQQPAIMPPDGSKAGKQYKEQFQQKHGFDPYASGGFVPNFATRVGDKLILDKANFKLFGSSTQIGKAFGVDYRVVDTHMNNKTPLTGTAALNDLLFSSDSRKTTITGKEKLADVVNALTNEGIKYIERDFDIRRPPKGQIKSEAHAEQRVQNLLNKEQRGAATNHLIY